MAKRFFRVEKADRPDLAAIGSISQLDVKGYAFPKIFPLMPVTGKSGTMTVAPAGLTASKGTKARANGTALSGTAISMVDVKWSVSRYEGRGKLFEDDGAAYASAEAADNAGAELSQRLAWNKVEDDAFATVFNATRYAAATTLTNHSVVKILQQKAKSLRMYGKPTLVMTTNAWLDFCEIPEIRYRLEKLAGAANDTGFIMTDIEKVRAAVSTFMGFNDIVLFDSEIVGTSYDDCVAVIGLRPEANGNAVSTAKSKATYGWTPVYIPEDAPADKPFDMRAWYDDDDKCNVYDAEAFLGVVEAFSAGVAMCKFDSAYTEYPSTVVNVGR
ncbi:MAG: hypothetical protein II823_06840 [Kiritimatiellae bacterium]|nr:hypothetical protein [Kiritimatiellia bacterium]